ncbi:retrovirus-related pol polyprotein from transposon TNT 1-94 [Tanacetum coccineum]
MSKVLHERGFGSLPSSTKTNLRDHVKSILTIVEADMTPIRRIGSSQYAVSAQQNSKLMFESRLATIPFPSRLNNYYCDEKKGSYGLQCLYAYSYGATRDNDSLPRKENDLGSLGELAHTKLTIELADRTVKRPKGIAENVLVGIGKFVFPVDFIILDMPEDVKVPLILGRPFLSTAHAKIDVFKRKITLRVGDEKIIFKSVKPANSLIKRVYMLSLRERMEPDLEARLMGETLVLNRSLDPLYGDYIELNDLNVPLELRKDQVDDLIPTIEEGEVFLYGDLAEKKSTKLVKYRSSGILLIMEYLMKISKKARILELKRRHLKITILTSYTPYPSRKIWRIYAYTSQETTKIQSPIRHIQETSIRRIQDKVIKYSRRYRTWSLLQETPDMPYPSLLIHRID